MQSFRFFRSARTSYRTFDFRSPAPPVRAKNPDHLYSLTEKKRKREEEKMRKRENEKKRKRKKSRSPLQPYKSSQDHCQPIKPYIL